MHCEVLIPTLLKEAVTDERLLSQLQYFQTLPYFESTLFLFMALKVNPLKEEGLKCFV